MPCFPPFPKGKRTAKRHPRSQQVSDARLPPQPSTTPLPLEQPPQGGARLIPTEPPTLTLDTSFGGINISPFNLPQTSVPGPSTQPHPLPSRGKQLIPTGAPTLTLDTSFGEFKLDPFDDWRQTRAPGSPTQPHTGVQLSPQPAQTLAHDDRPSGSLGVSLGGVAAHAGPSGSRHQLVPTPRLPAIAVEAKSTLPRAVQRENSLSARSPSNLATLSPAIPRSSPPRVTPPPPGPSHSATSDSVASSSRSNPATSSRENPCSSTPRATKLLPPLHSANLRSGAEHSPLNLVISSLANSSPLTPCVTPSLSATEHPATTSSGTLPSAISPSAASPSSAPASATLPSETLSSATLPSATTLSAPSPSAPSPAVDRGTVTTRAPSAISPLVAPSSSLPIELLYIIADCLGTNNDKASRAALAQIMCTSKAMYHMAARRLYRTIVVDKNFGRLVECLPTLPKRHGQQRSCDSHQTSCGTRDIPWQPPVQAPYGTLELLRKFTTTIVATDVPDSVMWMLFDKIGKQERWHWSNHKSWRTARPSMFPGVSRVIVTPPGYRRLQHFYTYTVARYGSTSGGLQHPLVELLGTEVDPQTLSIEYPTAGEIRRGLMADRNWRYIADNPSHVQSRIEKCLEGPSRWIEELTDHWERLAAVILFTTCDSHNLGTISPSVSVVTKVDRESGKTTQVAQQELARARTAARRQASGTYGGCLEPIGHQGDKYPDRPRARVRVPRRDTVVQ